ncbi:GNAT family N-acetyltransferase [Paenibacillus uliginis]|uniref:GNAT family N-acetyltransferase n=1 Tax=Paenibacillus uliginis TaxID=683737 RepID=UPI001AD81068|nr:hypothetical protein [Paenibacillus uliginis]
MKTEITTNRLFLRQLDNSDLQDIYRQFSDYDKCRFFSDPPCTIEEAQDIFNHYQHKNGDKDTQKKL